MNTNIKNILSFIDYDFEQEKYFSKDDLKDIDNYIYFTRLKKQNLNIVIHKTIFKSYNFMRIESADHIDYESLSILKDILHDGSVTKAFERFHDSLNISMLTYEVQRTIQNGFYYIIDLIHKEKINEIWFVDVPHLPLEILTYKIAEKTNLNIKYTFWLPRKESDDLMEGILSSRITSMPNKFHLLVNGCKQLTHPETTTPKTKTKSSEHKYMYAEYKPLVIKKNFINFISLIKYHGLSGSIRKTNKYIQFLIKVILNQIQLERILRYSQKISLSDVPKDIDYFYFPLHYQPEASTQIRAGVFDDQINLINLISTLLPINKYLVVKEHPAYWLRKWNTQINFYRSKGFYSSIQKKNNVIFVNHSLGSESLIKNSDGVIGITGTVVLEAIKSNKVTMIFGNTPYSDLPNVFSPKETNEILHFLSSKYQFDSFFDFSVIEEIFSKISYHVNSKRLQSENPIIRIQEFKKIIHEYTWSNNDS